MTNSEPTFEDTILGMKALSASLRTRAARINERADKVDAAIEVMLEEREPSEIPPGIGDATPPADLEEKTALTPAKGVAPTTVKMMAFIMKRGDTPVPEIQAYLSTLGKDNYDTLRSQLASFAEPTKGWLVRVSKGVYRVTPLGAEKCGLKYEQASV